MTDAAFSTTETREERFPRRRTAFPTIGDPACIDAQAREAARLLDAVIQGAHLQDQTVDRVTLEIIVRQHVFDRLCVWAAANEDFECDDPELEIEGPDEGA